MRLPFRLWLIGTSFGIALLAGVCGLEAWVRTTELPKLDAPLSTEMLDVHGQVMRITLASDGRWRLPAGAQDVDAEYIAQLIAYEDKRFLSHGGVDILAFARAGMQALRRGEIKSGGSTLTMQVARLLEGSGTGRWRGKLRQIRLALALERRLTKEEILSLYLTRAPFGGNLEGVRAAAHAYLGKGPGRLSAAEAAFLVALPQAPESRRPDRYPQVAKRGRDRVIGRLTAIGFLTAADADRARSSPAPEARAMMPNLAAHLGDRLMRQMPEQRVLRTHIDAAVQVHAEKVLSGALRGRGGLTGAILVADLASGHIRASASGLSYTDASRAGFLDMSRRIRSPGSTLKPLIYALAFEAGLAHPETLIEDVPMRFGAYAPENFDGSYVGTLSLREALQTSRNVPAVALLDRVGPARLTSRLRRLQLDVQTTGDGAPGLALALGGAGLTLEDLVTLYAALGNEGAGMRLTAAGDAAGPVQLIESRAAWYTGEILRGISAPGRMGKGEIAYKTGTSYGHRDAWSIGFDGRHVVGIWLGRADAGAVPGLSGQGDAAPLLVTMFDRLGVKPLPLPPSDALLVTNAELPRPLRAFRTASSSYSEDGPEIASPPDGARVELGLRPGEGEKSLAVRLGPGGQAPFTWLVDGRVIGRSFRREEFQWPVSDPGYVEITVIDRSGSSAQIHVELR
ncbi:penicillin-binding protein 1C [Algicella marina]|uniref:peptidoglycan glycosyltransferase n=1 Tax=Algicella marina TaxID=2683284 RepID=A0A6P1SZL5_9RHOB|nr:penicillin-binding protein 1C [Algicella marina]QHQ33682.1 penicillin-binding protein 1C [Algicella marina]